MKKLFYFLWMAIFALDASNAAAEDGGQIVLEVTVMSVSYRPTPAPHNRIAKRWDVVVKVDKIIQGGSSVIEPNRLCHLFDHSVVRSFDREREELAGSCYKIIYSERFSSEYDGGFIAIRVGRQKDRQESTP